MTDNNAFKIILFLILSSLLLFTIIFDEKKYSFFVMILLFLNLIINTLTKKEKFIDICSPQYAFPALYYILYTAGSIYLYIRDDELYFETYLYAIIGFIFYKLGLVLAKTNPRANFQTIISDWSTFKTYGIMASIFFLSIISAIFIYSKIGIPILSKDIFYIRTYGFEEVTHYSLFILRNCGIVTYFIYIHNAINKKNKNITYSIIILSTALMLSTAGRADFFFILIPLIINYHYLSTKISIKKGIVIFSIFIISIISYNFLRLFRINDDHETLIYLSSITSNYIYAFLLHILGQISLVGVCFADVIRYIPEQLPYSYGKLIPQTLSTFLPGHQSPPGMLLKNAAQINFTGGQANLTLLGDFYYDFGVIGICLGMLFLGYILQYFYNNFIRYKTSTSLIIYSYILYSYIVGIPGGLFSQAIRYYYLLIIIISCLIIKEKKYENIRNIPKNFIYGKK